MPRPTHLPDPTEGTASLTPFDGECRAAWEALQSWKNRLLDTAAANPLEALIVVVTGGALVFYLAEKEVNPQVRTYTDALHYVSTCLSVGYARAYPTTQIGMLVGAIVMCIGPSLSSWVIEGRIVAKAGEAAAAPGAEMRPVVDRLDEILQVLRSK
jgi:hypothetical protein